MSANKQVVITIDGREASGKGETSSRVAKRLAMDKLDSGSLYRTVALQIQREGIGADQVDEIEAFAPSVISRMEMKDGILCFDGLPVGEEIRTPQVSNFTPLISPLPLVRQLLIPLQRARVGASGLVAEGRDMGSVVFPDAMLKIFLTAPEQIRAERRYLDYRSRQQPISLETVLASLRERDRRDTVRKDSPLIQSPEAYVIDTGIFTPSEVENLIANLWMKVK